MHYGVHRTLWNARCTTECIKHYRLHRTLRSALCTTECTEHCGVHRTLRSALCTTECTEHCGVHITMQSSLCTTQCTQHCGRHCGVHCALRKSEGTRSPRPSSAQISSCLQLSVVSVGCIYSYRYLPDRLSVCVLPMTRLVVHNVQYTSIVTCRTLQLISFLV